MCMPEPRSVCWAMVGEPLVRGLGQRLVGRVQEVGVGALAAAADAAAKLVQLRQAEGVGAVDDERVGVGDVDARLDDRGADEHVDLLVPEVDDDLLECVLAHLAVGDSDAGIRDELGESPGDPVDRLDTVVDEEDLPLAHELAIDGGGDLLVVVRADEGQDGMALLGRRLDHRHLADARHRHLQRSRDRAWPTSRARRRSCAGP